MYCSLLYSLFSIFSLKFVVLFGNSGKKVYGKEVIQNSSWKIHQSIEESPFFITKPPENILLHLGDSIVINCIAKGNPQPHISWQRDVFERIYTLPNNSLWIKKATLSDSGRYSCLADNGLGQIYTSFHILLRVDGEFNEWSSWTECNTTCGDGVKFRSRSCSNPIPRNGGKLCNGSLYEEVTCQGNRCDVDGGYGEWSEWLQCSKTCNGGQQFRFRRCDSPRPLGKGKHCNPNAATQAQLCNTFSCNVPQAIGKVLGILHGNINKTKILAGGLMANITPGVNETLNMKITLENIPQSITHSFKMMSLFLTPLYWGVIEDIAGLRISNGRYSYNGEVKYSTGEMVILKSHVRYIPQSKMIFLEFEVNGSLPKINQDDDLTVDSFKENVIQVEDQRLHGHATQTISIKNDVEKILYGSINFNVTYDTGERMEPPYREYSIDIIKIQADVLKENIQFLVNVSFIKDRVCPDGFRRNGFFCQDINECTSALCEQMCTNSHGGFQCGCTQGYVLNKNGLHCNDINECNETTQKCSDGLVCINTPGWYNCVVDDCSHGYVLNSDTGLCDDVDECVIRSHNCTKDEICKNLIGSYRCDVLPCLFGYRRNALGKCEDIDECASNQHNCPAKTVCKNLVGDYKCIIQPRLTLQSVEEPRQQNDKKTHIPDEEIHFTDQSIDKETHLSVETTELPMGEIHLPVQVPDKETGNYTTSDNASPGKDHASSDGEADHSTSFIVDEAEKRKTYRSRMIAPSLSTAHNIGNVTGKQMSADKIKILKEIPKNASTSTSRTVILSTSSEIQIPNAATISSSTSTSNKSLLETTSQPPSTLQTSETHPRRPNSYDHTDDGIDTNKKLRQCNSGFKKDSFGDCIDINECLTLAPCQHYCSNLIGSFECSCHLGYVLQLDGFTCVDFDECIYYKGICGKNKICVNKQGNYTCINACPRGYERDKHGNCIDIDECKSGRHHCSKNFLCVNQQGSYHCMCPRGYIRMPGQGCVDIDECSMTGVVICEHKCVNLIGSYQCQCDQGYALQEDGFTCGKMFKNTARTSTLDIKTTVKFVTKQTSNTTTILPTKTTVKTLIKTTIPTLTLTPTQTPTTTISPTTRPPTSNSKAKISFATTTRTETNSGTCPAWYSNLCDWKCERLKKGKTTGRSQCLCPDGYKKYYFGHCHDINECRSTVINPCKEHEKCFNTKGSYRCVDYSCPLGYHQLSKGSCMKSCYLTSKYGICHRRYLFYHTISLTKNVPVGQHLLTLSANEELFIGGSNTERIFDFHLVRGNNHFKLKIHTDSADLLARQVLNGTRNFDVVLLSEIYNTRSKRLLCTIKFVVYVNVGEYEF